MQRTLTLSSWPLAALAALSLACSSGGGSGTPTFSKSYGAGGDDAAVRAIATSDGGYVFTGTIGMAFDPTLEGRLPASRAEHGDLWVAKLDALGDEVWSRAIGLQRPELEAGLRFLLARRAPDGTTWTAHRDELATPKTGDPIADGGNVVLSHYDASGGLLDTFVLDPGIPSDLTPADPNGTSVETVYDLWPTQDGDVLVAAAANLRVVENGLVRVHEALWVFEVSPTGTIRWQDYRRPDSGEFQYFGPGTAVRRVFVREVVDGWAFLVATGLDENDAGNLPSEFVEYSNGGSVLASATRNLSVLDVDTWDDGADGTIDGVVAVGFNDDGEAELVHYQVNAIEVTSWTSPVDAFEHVATRVWHDTDGAHTEFWVSYGPIVERWRDDGTFLGAEAGGDDVLAMEYDAANDWIRVVREERVTSVDDAFQQPVSEAWTATRRGWFGPGGLLLEEANVLRLLDEDALETGTLARGDSKSVSETGLDVIELDDGSLLLSGAMLYDPGDFGAELEDDPEHAWLVSLDASGQLLWQTAFARGEGTLAFDPIPLAPRDTGALLGLGAPNFRAFTVNEAGTPVVSTNTFAGPIGGLTEHPDGGYVALSLYQSAVTRLGPELSTEWTRITFEYSGEGSLAVAADGTIGVATAHSSVPDGALDSVALWTLDDGGDLVGAVELEFGSLELAGVPCVAARPDGGFVVAATVLDAADPLESGGANGLLVAVDAALAPTWFQLYGALDQDYVTSLVALEDGYLVAGHSLSLGEGSEAWLLRVGADGLVTDGCPARLDGGDWPASWGHASVVPTLSTPGVPNESDPPISVAVELAPSAGPAIVVARQCSGVAVDVEPPSDPDEPDEPGPGEATLTVIFRGDGEGRVIANGDYLDCTATCSRSVPAGIELFLAPQIVEPWFFSHWAGVDQDFGIEGAVVFMDGDRTVEVWFE